MKNRRTVSLRFTTIVLVKIIFAAATHCTEIRYVLGKGIISKFRPNEDDRKMIELMTGYFSNFAKYGYMIF